MFDHNVFKRELIRTKVPEGTRTTVYRNGSFVDLCLGHMYPKHEYDQGNEGVQT